MCYPSHKQRNQRPGLLHLSMLLPQLLIEQHLLLLHQVLSTVSYQPAAGWGQLAMGVKTLRMAALLIKNQVLRQHRRLMLRRARHDCVYAHWKQTKWLHGTWLAMHTANQLGLERRPKHCGLVQVTSAAQSLACTLHNAGGVVT